jgi:GNAT superfamily N-acetyltransferase
MISGMRDADRGITVVPANVAGWPDLQTIFGTRGQTSRCQCQRYKLPSKDYFESVGIEERAGSLREQTDCEHPRSSTTSGLVAYLDGLPVGWCAVEPRTEYPRLVKSIQVPWEGRDEDRQDSSVWAVTCFVTRAGFRRRGVTRVLAAAAVDHARSQGARALEGYPITTTEVILEELHVGTVGTFSAAGLQVVSRPTPRRVVMRIDF